MFFIAVDVAAIVEDAVDVVAALFNNKPKNEVTEGKVIAVCSLANAG
jgi:hypothetical protein